MIQIIIGVLALVAALLGVISCVGEKNKRAKVYRIIESVFFALLGFSDLF